MHNALSGDIHAHAIYTVSIDNTTLTVNDDTLSRLHEWADPFSGFAAMMEHMASLSSYLSESEKMCESLERLLLQVKNLRYADLKSKPVIDFLPDSSPIKDADKKAQPSDRFVSAFIDSSDPVIPDSILSNYFTRDTSLTVRQAERELRRARYSVMRLKRSLELLDVVWNTARTLNANERRLAGG